MKQPIPSEALDKHIAFLGATGSGKTSAAKSGVVEPSLIAGERVLMIDPTGAWWGLRVSAGGKSNGFPIYIFGGDHGDFPLRAKDAGVLAEAFGTSSDSAIFDTSLMTVAERTAFFTEFAETLRRKNKGPVKLIIDEAHLFMPQSGAKAGGAMPAMLHAGNNLVSLGRSKGLRITLISQRPAKLHKDSLTQVQSLVAMRLMAPQDRKAVSEWIADQADSEKGKAIVASLPSLKPGEAWVWAPDANVLNRVTFDRPRTFDSSRAPDAHDGVGPQLAPINLDALKGRLDSVETEAKANDPKVLKAEIARLTKELNGLGPDLTAIQQGYERGLAEGLAKGESRAKDALKEALTAQDRLAGILAGAIERLNSPVPAAAPRRDVAAPPARAAQPATDGPTSPTVRKILDEIHRSYPVALSFEAAALRAAVSRRSSAYGSYRKHVEGSAEIEHRQDGKLQSAPGYANPVSAGGDPIEAFAARLPPSYAGMLRAIAASSSSMTKEEIADAANVSPTSSGLTGGLRELMALSLVEKDGNSYSIHSELAR